MNDGGNARTYSNARKTVVADLAEEFLHSAACTLFKGITHEIHADDEHADTRKQPYQATDKFH